VVSGAWVLLVDHEDASTLRQSQLTPLDAVVRMMLSLHCFVKWMVYETHQSFSWAVVLMRLPHVYSLVVLYHHLDAMTIQFAWELKSSLLQGVMVDEPFVCPLVFHQRYHSLQFVVCDQGLKGKRRRLGHAL
jgi:hypothetical protein